MGKILGSGSSILLIQFKLNCCAETAKLCVKYSREASTLKMATSIVKVEIKLERKSKKTTFASHKFRTERVTVRNKASVCVVFKLMIQKQEGNNLILIQQVNYFTTHKQLLDFKAIFKPYIVNIEDFMQQVDYIAVSVARTLDQLAIFIHKSCDAIMPLKKNLAEYGHFQGSWSVPRRSGSRVGKLRLIVDSGKLGLMGVSGKLKEDVQEGEENNLKGKTLMKRLRNTIFLFIWDCISKIRMASLIRHVFLRQKQNLSEP